MIEKYSRVNKEFDKAKYISLLNLSEEIILEVDKHYIDSMWYGEFDVIQSRKLGFAIECKFKEYLGPSYKSGIKYKTDYVTTIDDINYDIELKTTCGKNFTISKDEYNIHHQKIDPLYIFATTIKLEPDIYSFKIDNIIRFSDFRNYVHASSFDDSKFIRRNEIILFQ